MISLLGLYGSSRVGKDEVARILVEDFGFEQRVQAEAIREILLRMNPYLIDKEGDLVQLRWLFEECGENWNKVKIKAPMAVDLMISLGQAVRDIIDWNTWIKKVFPPIGDTQKIVVSDIRQLNEYEAIKERGGEVWRVTRPSVTEKRGMDGLLDHLTFDAHIDNRGSLADLRGIVQATIATSIRNKEVRKNVGIRF